MILQRKSNATDLSAPPLSSTLTPKRPISSLPVMSAMHMWSKAFGGWLMGGASLRTLRPGRHDRAERKRNQLFLFLSQLRHVRHPAGFNSILYFIRFQGLTSSTRRPLDSNSAVEHVKIYRFRYMREPETPNQLEIIWNQLEII